MEKTKITIRRGDTVLEFYGKVTVCEPFEPKDIYQIDVDLWEDFQKNEEVLRNDLFNKPSQGGDK